MPRIILAITFSILPKDFVFLRGCRRIDMHGTLMDLAPQNLPSFKHVDVHQKAHLGPEREPYNSRS